VSKFHEHPTKNDFVGTYPRFLAYVEQTHGPLGIKKIVPKPIIILPTISKLAKYEGPASRLVVGIVIIAIPFQALVCMLINLAFP